MPEPAPAPELARDEGWQRLDPRMLLVHPVREVTRFLPAVLLAVFLGSTGQYGAWSWLAVALPVAIGLLRYLTTRFRIVAGRVELRSGLVSRSRLAAPLDRVRTVELTATPIHRVLGLSVVRIGTGQGGKGDKAGIDLDALPAARARELRRELLRRADAPAPLSPAPTPTGVVPDRPAPQDGRSGTLTSGTTPVGARAPGTPGFPGTPSGPDAEVVFGFRPVWLRYAPLTSTGWVVAAAALGGLAQLLNGLDAWERFGRLDVQAASLWLLAAVVVVGLVLTVTVLAVAGSALANLGFTLSRTTSGGAPGWDVRRGLLTTRETSIDAARVRGVSVVEPLGLRLAGAARLTAIVTGLDRSERGSATLVPPVPHPVVTAVGQAVLHTSAALAGPLRAHGPRATRRRWTRALVPALVLAAAVVAVVLGTGLPRWLLLLAVLPPAVGAGLAADRVRALGHRLDPGWLTVRSGSLLRRRTTLQTAGIIGWTVRQSFFQRRAGLVTLVATSAGGSQAYPALDLPLADAVPLADAATPGLLTPFLVGAGGPGGPGGPGEARP